MLSLASFSSFQLISLLPSDWPDPGWGVLELRSASEPARSAGKGDWKHVRWSKPWNKFFIWPNPRNLSRQKIWRGWRGPSAPPEHKEAQIRTKKKEKQNCIYIYTRGWNKNVKCRYQYTHFLHIHLWRVELLRNVIKVTLLGGSGINYTSLCLLMITHSSLCDFIPWFFIICHTHIRCYICILRPGTSDMWCGVLGMWRTVFQEIHNEPEHRKISLSTVSLLPWEGNPSCRSACVCVCHSEIHRGLESLTLSLTLAHTHKHTLCPKSFVCLFWV